MRTPYVSVQMYCAHRSHDGMRLGAMKKPEKRICGTIMTGSISLATLVTVMDDPSNNATAVDAMPIA